MRVFSSVTPSDCSAFSVSIVSSSRVGGARVSTATVGTRAARSRSAVFCVAATSKTDGWTGMIARSTLRAIISIAGAVCGGVSMNTTSNASVSAASKTFRSSAARAWATGGARPPRACPQTPDALACGSVSTIAVLKPLRSAATARWTHKVVFAAPPFCWTSTIRRKFVPPDGVHHALNITHHVEWARLRGPLSLLTVSLVRPDTLVRAA